MSADHSQGKDEPADDAAAAEDESASGAPVDSVASDPSPEPASAEEGDARDAEDDGELDLESQLDELAASLDFDLDDAAADEALDEALDQPLDSATDDEGSADDPELATAPADEGDAIGDPGELPADGIPSEEVEEVHSMEVLESEEALELDDTDVEELDSMAELVHDEDEGEVVIAPIEPAESLDADLDQMAAELEEAEPQTQPLPDVEAAGDTLYLVLDGRVATVDQDRFVIGRVSKMCDFAIIDVNISRQHCAIERRDDGYYVVDLGSTNGVVIDGTRVDNHRIAEGDVLVLSSHRVQATFVVPDVSEQDPGVDLAPLEAAAEPLVTGRVQAIPREAPAEASGEVTTDSAQAADEVRHEESLPSPGYRPAPMGLDSPTQSGTQPLEPLPRTETVTGARPVAPAPHAPGTAPHAAVGAAPAEPRATMVPTGTTPGFEQRMEMRLEQMSQQIAYLQQSMQVLLAQMQQLQGVAGLAQMIQQRMAAKQGGSR